MGILTELIARKFDTDHEQAQTKLDAYRSIISSQESTPEAKEYALSQVLHTAGFKGKEHGAVGQILGHLLGVGKGKGQAQSAAAQPQQPTTDANPMQAGGPQGEPEAQPATPQLQPMPKRGRSAEQPQAPPMPKRWYMTPEEIGQRKLNIEKPELDYRAAQQRNLENLKEEHQEKLKALEAASKEKIEVSKEAAKLAGDQAKAGRLTGKAKQDWDTAKALVRQEGGDPENHEQVQARLDKTLNRRAKYEHDMETERLVKNQIGIGKAIQQLNEQGDAKGRKGAAGEDTGDVSEISRAIMNGEQPPDMVGMARGGLAAKIRGELARKGFNLAHAQMDWKATQRALSTMNSSQQMRIRQSLDSLSTMLPNVEQAYDEWTKTKLPGGFKIYNKIALKAAANGSGPSSAIAQNLLTLINDSVAESGYVYMGGNSPTDHALRLAGTNLSGDWNPETFKATMQTLKNNLQIRRNSINNVNIAGSTDENPYAPPKPAQQSAPPAAVSKPKAPAKANDPLDIR